MKEALLVIDIQNDFLPGGALAVPDGDQVVAVANVLMRQFNLVFASQDWHPADHCGYADRYPAQKTFDVITLDGIEQVLWPRHCQQDTQGAAFAAQLETQHFSAVIQKGTDPHIDSYSAFYDNGRRKQTDLAARLHAAQVTKLYLVGLASEYCVAYSAADALQAGFETLIIEDGVRGLNEADTQKAFADLRAKGVRFTHSQALLQQA